MQKLLAMGIETTALQAKALAKAIRAGMWEWYIILGYALAFLMIYRIVLYFKEKFSELSLHKKGVKSLYYLVYTALFFMSISGFVIEFYQDLGLSKEMTHNIKDIHELAFNILLYFVPAHLLGLLIAENRDEKGVVFTMINGKV